ncbi:hypothetical protein [Magnetospirillum sp. XM-1]|uniref:hypothetical protein n=1 Tax=Magnetospirillum sp. XM-1 TaxID=1663591 RepID=UPI0012E3CAB4|nr:hypothetical protein [Magnetospirillum sp. XM-1]
MDSNQPIMPLTGRLPADVTIEDILGQITLPLPSQMPPIPSGFSGVVASIIRTPCQEPCLHDAVYLGYHLIPASLRSRVRPGCDIHELLYLLEAATSHVPVGRCSCCHAPGRETTGVDFQDLACRLEIDRQSPDESYEHLGVWSFFMGDQRWTTLGLHWSVSISRY